MDRRGGRGRVRERTRACGAHTRSGSVLLSLGNPTPSTSLTGSIVWPISGRITMPLPLHRARLQRDPLLLGPRDERPPRARASHRGHFVPVRTQPRRTHTRVFGAVLMPSPGQTMRDLARSPFFATIVRAVLITRDAQHSSEINFCRGGGKVGAFHLQVTLRRWKFVLFRYASSHRPYLKDPLRSVFVSRASAIVKCSEANIPRAYRRSPERRSSLHLRSACLI